MPPKLKFLWWDFLQLSYPTSGTTWVRYLIRIIYNLNTNCTDSLPVWRLIQIYFKVSSRRCDGTLHREHVQRHLSAQEGLLWGGCARGRRNRCHGENPRSHNGQWCSRGETSSGTDPIKNICLQSFPFFQIAFNHHAEMNHTAILLIRNPYEAIIGHRNLDR